MKRNLVILGMCVTWITSCGPSAVAIIHPGQNEPLGYADLPPTWHRVGITSGGRSTNLFVPKNLGLASAENETRPAMSMDLIGSTEKAFEGPYDQEYWIHRHIADVRYHEALDLVAKKYISVSNPDLGEISVYRLQGGSWGDSLMSIIVDNGGWYLAELRTNDSKSVNAYGEDFMHVLKTLRLESGEQGVAPNRSLTPSLKSTSSVRGSEDF